MNISIEELTNLQQLPEQLIDDSFRIDSVLVITGTDQGIQYEVKPVPSYTKSYSEQQEDDADDIDYSTYIDHPDQKIFIAYAGNRVAGLIVLKRNWNHYGYIEDIKVDRQFRRYGIGRQLIDKAKSWAKSGGMPGLMLETQNNNVQACRFYESCGFVLGGFDSFVYKGFNKNKDEVALYWYFLFEED